MANGSDERALRAELAELRAQLAEQRRANVLLAEENSALREKLTELAGQVAELQRRLGQNPRNSNRPPSSEGLGKPAPRSRRQRTEREPGGQPGHEGTTLRQVAEPDRVVVHAPARCRCGRSLRRAPVTSTELRQVFDLPEIRLAVTEHRIEHRACTCGRVSMAGAEDGVPAGLGAPAQYGPGVRALATYLMAGQHLPVARTAELLAELVGAPICEGTLVAWYAQAADGLADFDAALVSGLSAAQVLGADESGLRVDGKLAWEHVASTDTLTRYTVHQGAGARGAEAMRADGVLPALRKDAVVVHDCWGPYWDFEVRHALCAAHLGRELVAAADVDGQTAWADGLDRLLAEINRTVVAAREAGADGLHPQLLAAYRRRYESLLAAGWTANPDHHAGQRGKRKRPKHVNLLDRLDSHRDEVLRFAEDFRVPHTNNRSEQDIRPTKIRMKVSGCLRTMAGARAFCRLRSYLSTARKQGQSAFTVLRMLHQGSPWMPALSGIT